MKRAVRVGPLILDGDCISVRRGTLELGGSMKRSYLLLTVAVLAAVLVAPACAFAFTITGGGGTQTQNPYGLWFAGQEACAQEGCHSGIAAERSPHGDMVTDVKAFPSALV